MQFLSLIFSVIYYALVPTHPMKSWNKAQGGFIGLMLVMIWIVSSYSSTTTKTSLLSYSPGQDQSTNLPQFFLQLYEQGNTLLAQNMYEEFLLYYSPTPSLALETVGLQLFPAKQLQARLAQIDFHLLSHPTSRDLWLQKARTALALRDSDAFEKAGDVLIILDPNNEAVRALFDFN